MVGGLQMGVACGDTVWVRGYVMDKTQQILNRRGLPLPAHVVLQADNTCREQRNQWLLLWGGTLLLKNLFRSVSYTFYTVGHTHNEVDQRFAVVRAALNRATTLQTPQARPPPMLSQQATKLQQCLQLCLPFAQTRRCPPQDFAQQIRQFVRPAKGRELIVDILDGSWDFQDYLRNLSTSISGLAIQDRTPVAHSIRLVLRADLKNYEGDKWEDVEDLAQRPRASVNASQSNCPLRLCWK